MMEVVIVDDGNRLTVYELVERVIPCIIAKHYSENYIQGFRSTFRNLLAYCNKNEKKYFTAELAQQFMLDCYGVQKIMLRFLVNSLEVTSVLKDSQHNFFLRIKGVMLSST